ncbi:MAG TPA: UDP-N-acetylmuramate--L-alanine ligase [Patescibacteria group bacterium]|nr:UDP-N-acetylmuramate--L-alanine ligase [Patescibacteria group bacterium]
MYFDKTKKIHFIGIGGIGTSAIAKYFLSLGKTITGSDLYDSDLVKQLRHRGVKIFNSHQNSNVGPDTDLIIYSPAVPEDNPERLAAAALGLDQFSYPEILGELSRKYKTIAVAGTNGKSTTTAMLGKIFAAAGADPTVIVGTQVPGFDGNLRLGQSDILIIEACEWRAHMLNLSPQTIVLTNIAKDHLDFYKDLDDIRYHFQKFVNLLPLDGFLALNADDENLTKLISQKGYKVKSWGILNDQADYLAREIKTFAGGQSFSVGGDDFILQVPGKYNVYNALAALTVAKRFGLDSEVIKKSLAEFSSTWRRFEIIGPVRGKAETLVVSDYAHHPEALKGVIKAAKEFYPAKRLVAVFQPHHFDRTAKLFDDFVKSFNDADLVIINEIYDVAGREQDGVRTVTGQNLAAEIQKVNPSKEIIYSPNLAETQKRLLKKVKKNDLILIIGAGDIDEIAREITR